MRDDLGITTRIENGKAYLEFTLPEKLREGDACGGRLRIVIREAGDGRQIFCGEYDPGELEPMTALLLRPHLWNGMRDPYLYEVEACGNFRVDDALTQLWWRQKLAIYDLRVIEKKGIFLNDAELPLHVVEYHLPWESGNADQREEDGGWDPEMVTQDLELLACMGANALLVREEPDCSQMRFFHQICLERGFLTGNLWITEEKIPVYRGYPRSSGCPGETVREETATAQSPEELLAPDGRTLTENYYRYQAKWGTQPVLCPALSTLHRQPDGMLALTVYSNQKKVALYIEGVLFLFQSGGPEYIFEDIPVAKLPLRLALEAGNLNTALTISRIPSGSHNFHKEITFS